MSTGYEIVTVTEDFPAEEEHRWLQHVVPAPEGKRVVNTDARWTGYPPGSEPPPTTRVLGGGEIVEEGQAAAFNVQIEGPEMVWVGPGLDDWAPGGPGPTQRYTWTLICVDA